MICWKAIHGSAFDFDNDNDSLHYGFLITTDLLNAYYVSSIVLSIVHALSHVAYYYPY